MRSSDRQSESETQVTTEQLKEMILSRPGLRNRNIDIARELLYGNQADCALQDPQPEQPVRHGTLETDQGKEESPYRIIVRITAFVFQPIDTDNLCPKYLIDGLRYSGLIPDDGPGDIELTITQESCPSRKEERTEVTLIWP